MSARRAALLFGRLPPRAGFDEQDVLVQAATVGRALRELGWQVQRVPLDLNLRAAARRLARRAPDLVFNLVESVEGRDRLVHLAPALLDSLGLAYTGSPTAAIFLTSSKLLAKQQMLAAGVPTPAWTQIPPGEIPEPDFPPPYIVKSVWEHASIGLTSTSVARDRPGLEQELRRRAGGELFAEAYIEGREFNLALLEQAGRQPQVLPPAEIQFQSFPAGSPRIVDYAAKWESTSMQFAQTPRCFAFPDPDRGLLDALRQLALRCWRLFALGGYARVDFRVDAAGEPWVLEVNTNPCLSPNAGFLAAAAQAGLSPTEVVRRIVEGARS